MAFKDRLTRMFRRTTATPPQQPSAPTSAPTEASDEADPFAELEDGSANRALHATSRAVSEAREDERHQLLRQVGDGFIAVGGVLERLDEHLVSSQERLANLIDVATTQREIVDNQVALTKTNQELVTAVASHFQEREAAQTALLAHVQQLDDAMRLQREHEHRQLDRLLHAQRGGRRLVLMAMFLGAGLILVLIGLVLLLALRPDLITGQADTPQQSLESSPTQQRESSTEHNQGSFLPPQSELDPTLMRDLEAASRSTHPAIATMAARHLLAAPSASR